MATIKDGTGTYALAVYEKSARLQPCVFGRPLPSPNDVQLNLLYSGMCHSDLHNCNGDWGVESFPVTPGPEIAGAFTAVGAHVNKFAVGDRVGVGVYVHTCGTCPHCQSGRQNYCSQVLEAYAFQYPTGIGHDESANCTTNGGYSPSIVVPDNFVFAVPANIPLEYAGPLMCAGITMWTPLYEHVVEKRVTNVAMVWFGGLGQMGAKSARAMDANVTVLSRSLDKKEQAAALEADLSAHTDEAPWPYAAATLDLIVDTVSVHWEISILFGLLTVGVAEEVGVVPFRLIGKNIHLTGSLVGGLPVTQGILNFAVGTRLCRPLKSYRPPRRRRSFRPLPTAMSTPSGTSLTWVY